jgi:hypothetical protein
MIFAAAEFMGFVALWSDANTAETQRRHWVHRILAATLAAGFMLAGSPARAANQPLEVYGGWLSVTAWALLTFMLVTLAAQLVRMSVKEALRIDAKRQERVLAIGGLVIGLSVGATTIDAVLLAMLEQLGWVHSIEFRLKLHGYNIFWESVGTSLLSAVPALLVLRARAGLDATSSRWRRLQGLRASLIDAVPEIAFEVRGHQRRRQRSSLELHQTTVQIRDAILLLRQYFGHLGASETDAYYARHAIPNSQREAARQALLLAHAVRAKMAGLTPRTLDSGVISRSRSTNLEEETIDLLRLARWWPSACDTAHGSDLHQPEPTGEFL